MATPPSGRRRRSRSETLSASSSGRLDSSEKQCSSQPASAATLQNASAATLPPDTASNSGGATGGPEVTHVAAVTPAAEAPNTDPPTTKRRSSASLSPPIVVLPFAVASFRFEDASASTGGLPQQAGQARDRHEPGRKAVRVACTTMARDGEHAWRRTAGLCHRRSGVAYVVLPADHDQPLVLQDAAAEVFDALDEPGTTVDLIAALSERLGVDQATICPRLDSALALLADAGVITAASTSESSAEPPADAWIRHLLTRSTAAELPAPPQVEPLADEEWERCHGRVTTGRITGTLLDAVLSGDLPATDEQARQASLSHRNAMGVAVRLEQDLRLAGRILGEAGIDTRVLKGPAVAHLDYDDPSQRDFGDIDLLVHSADMTATVAALEVAGYERVLPAARSHLDQIFNKSVTLHSPGRWELDLHRALFPGAFGLVVSESGLWDDPEAFVVGDDAFVAMPRPMRILQTAGHLVLGSTTPRLSTVRDLVVQLDRLPDPAPLEQAARDTSLTAVLQAAIEHLVGRQLLVPGGWGEWAATEKPDQRGRRLLAEHLAARGDFNAQARSALRLLPLHQRLSVTAALALPHRDHLAARGLTRRRHLTRRLRRRNP